MERERERMIRMAGRQSMSSSPKFHNGTSLHQRSNRSQLSSDPAVGRRILPVRRMISPGCRRYSLHLQPRSEQSRLLASSAPQNPILPARLIAASL